MSRWRVQGRGGDMPGQQMCALTWCCVATATHCCTALHCTALHCTAAALLQDLYVLRRAVSVYEQLVRRFTAQVCALPTPCTCLLPLPSPYLTTPRAPLSPPPPLSDPPCLPPPSPLSAATEHGLPAAAVHLCRGAVHRDGLPQRGAQRAAHVAAAGRQVCACVCVGRAATHACRAGGICDQWALVGQGTVSLTQCHHLHSTDPTWLQRLCVLVCRGAALHPRAAAGDDVAARAGDGVGDGRQTDDAEHRGGGVPCDGGAGGLPRAAAGDWLLP